MSTITSTLKSFPDLLSLTPAQESEISKAETMLSLSFAPEYRQYLSEFGAAVVKSHELTGLLKSDRLNVVNVTKREREINPQVPHSMYVIENAAIDSIIIWQDTNGEVYQSSPNSAPKLIAASLVEYLTD